MLLTNYNSLYNFIGRFWEQSSNRELFNKLFDGLADSAVDLQMYADQVRDSYSVMDCPVYKERTWLFRDDLYWQDSGTFHRHIKEEFISSGKYDFSFSHQLDSVVLFWNGQRLNQDDEFTLSIDGVSFNDLVPAGAVITVYGDEVFYQRITTKEVDFTSPVNKYSFEFRFEKVNKISSVSYSSQELTGEFLKGEVYYIEEGASSERVYISSNRSSVSTSGVYTSPTIYKLLGFTVPYNSIDLDGNKLFFTNPIPPNTPIVVKDSVFQEVVVTSKPSQAITLSRDYDEATLSVLLYGVDVFDYDLGSSSLTLSSLFQAQAEVYGYAKRHTSHTHKSYSEEVETVTSYIMVDFDIDTDEVLKVFINGQHLNESEYEVVGDRRINFLTTAGTPLFLRAREAGIDGDQVRVFAVSTDESLSHLHIRDEFVVQAGESSFDISHRATPEFLEGESFLSGYLYDHEFADLSNVINLDFEGIVPIGTRVYLDLPAIEYPYFCIIDNELTEEGFVEDNFPVSYIEKAEELRPSVSTEGLTWVDPSTVSTSESTFTIEFFKSPSAVKIKSHQDYEEVFLKDVYINDYFMYRRFGSLFPKAPKANSEYYNKVVQAFVKGLFGGSTVYNIENGIDIIFNSPFVTDVGERITSISGEDVVTSEQEFSTGGYELRLREKYPKYHAFLNLFREVDPGDYIVYFGLSVSENFAVAERLDRAEDVEISGVGTSTATAVPGSGFEGVVVEDLSKNFITGSEGEVRPGDLVYLKSPSYEIVSTVEVVDEHELELKDFTNFISYYTDVYTGVLAPGTTYYKVYARRTERLDEGSRMGQLLSDDVVVSVLDGVLKNVRVFEIEWGVLYDSKLQQEFGKAYLNRIIPAFQYPQVFSECYVDVGAPSSTYASQIASHFNGTDLIKQIVLGSGGDLDYTSKADTGARQGHNSSETEVRSEILRIPISKVEQNAGEAIFYGAVSPDQLQSENINELGLLNESGELVAHYIFEADAVGRAKKFVKTDFLWMIFKWRIG